MSREIGNLLYPPGTPSVNAVNRNRVAYMSSLREMSIIDVSTDFPALSLEIDIEPSFIGLGPKHTAIGMNNR